MRVPEELSSAFGEAFEELISRFAAENGLMPDAESIHSPRYLARSVVPHILKLSALFNRIEAAPEPDPENRELSRKKLPSPRAKALKTEQSRGLEPYWKAGSNPAHLRLAYFLYFMPSNLYRVASVWAELARLGYRWPPGQALRAIEFGAGPAAGACGIAAAESIAPVGIPPSQGDWALIEQDQAMLDLGRKWSQSYFSERGLEWGTRPFHRKISLQEGLLPPRAPKFNLWVMSYFLNEFSESPASIARALIQDWEKHLADEGIVILVEPALKLQSRKLLEIRRELLLLAPEKAPWLQVLLPCLGHQACGALAAPEDWCHEEVSWWRPPYFRTLDKMAELDRKSLPFSYLVLTRSKRPREEILPALAGAAANDRYRLVSPAHGEGKELEFFTCGQEGKRRARYRPKAKDDAGAELNRGDILVGAEVRGDTNSSRFEKIKKIN